MEGVQFKRWQEETQALREIALGGGLTEEKKWGKPCFTLSGKNVVIIIALKDSCNFSFMQGALLTDPKGLLQQVGENTLAGRWAKFTSVKEIEKSKRELKGFVKEAIALQKAGAKVPKRTGELELPEELTAKFETMPKLETAFRALTPGRQRAYVLHFAGAKQSATRVTRIEKWVPEILAGRGWNERGRD
jgi:uncharacterized protein YdeI (YjbR/CyaY-like superfamily)